jgi:hypothetical protein
VPLIVLAVMAGACAEPNPEPNQEEGLDASVAGIPHETEPSALLLRWGLEGGFTPPEFQLTNLPSFSLYGDGTIVRPGAQIAIYPGPSLPALESMRVDEVGIQAILEAAFDVGLDRVDDMTDLGSVGIADAPETVFTLHAGGVDRTVRVYALSELGGRPPGMPSDEYAARRALLRLIDDLGSLQRWLPEGSVVTEGDYASTASMVFVFNYRGQEGLQQSPIQWPLGTPLEGIGEATDAGFRCVTVSGEDWIDRLAPAADRANRLTPWVSDGQRFGLVFRPLLPDDSGC